MFEMQSKDKNYHVRYTFKILDNDLIELEYYEWVDRQEIAEPFNLDILEKLKLIIKN